MNKLKDSLIVRFFVFLIILEFINLPILLINEALNVSIWKAFLSSVIFWPGGVSFLYFIGLAIVLKLLEVAKLNKSKRWKYTNLIANGAFILIIYAGFSSWSNDELNQFHIVFYLMQLLNVLIAYILFFIPFFIKEEKS